MARPPAPPVPRPQVLDSGPPPRPASQYPDLLGHLSAEYLKECDKAGVRFPAKVADHLARFLAFCQGYLSAHPPVSTAYVGRGIALGLQGGPTVVFTAQDEPRVRANSVSITTPQSQPGQDGISGTDSVPITGGPAQEKSVAPAPPHAQTDQSPAQSGGPGVRQSRPKGRTPARR